jgi:DegV family protein with EDD domain
MDYIFMTDSDSDLHYTQVDEMQIPVVRMPYMLDGKEYFDDMGRSGGIKDFYANMRAGAAPITSLLPTDAYLEYFEPLLKEGNDILFLAFSSELSATIQNIYTARKELLEKYPQRKLLVVDTWSISAPQINLILPAFELYKQGKSMEEVAAWVEANKMRSQAWITVEDLKYLKRGGRISSTAAVMGTMLDLKPILALGRNGKIVPAEKVQGRKKAMRILSERTAENIENPESQTMIIMHADCLEDAQRLEELIRQKVPNIKDIHTIMVGPVIGAHCGPGTLASCFLGKERSI